MYIYNLASQSRKYLSWKDFLTVSAQLVQKDVEILTFSVVLPTDHVGYGAVSLMQLFAHTPLCFRYVMFGAIGARILLKYLRSSKR